MKNPKKKLTTLRELPSVMAFRRGHIVSDAEMFNVFDGRNRSPVLVFRQGVLGTQNVNDGKGNADPGHSSASATGIRGIGNPQMTDIARTDSESTAMLVTFSMRFLPLMELLDSCVSKDKDNQDMARRTVVDFLERSLDSKGLFEIACRYARNIANGRWLFRNRFQASSVVTSVFTKSMKEDGKKKLLGSFDSLSFGLNDFGGYSPTETMIATEIISQMKGESLDGIVIESTVNFGMPGSVEVFPSQQYLEKRKADKGGSSRYLYTLKYTMQNSGDIIGRAAIRDQKIFNAIRTIDTWYPDYEEVGIPIPVEPLGANMKNQMFYRKGKHSSFEIALRLSLVDPDREEGMFMLAAIDRGGVYGASVKSEKGEDRTESGDDTVQ